jgi:hypothetical protein
MSGLSDLSNWQFRGYKERKTHLERTVGGQEGVDVKGMWERRVGRPKESEEEQNGVQVEETEGTRATIEREGEVLRQVEMGGTRRLGDKRWGL